MPVQRSATTDVTRLMAELGSAEPLRRETAVARLAVIGARAVTRLIAVAADPQADKLARLSALQALEAIGDERALPTARALSAGDDAALAVGAIGVLGPLARGAGKQSSQALELLASLALGAGTPTDRKIAALASLEGLPEALLKPVYEALAKDPAARVVARVTRRQAGVLMPLDQLIEAGLSGDPEVVSAVIREDAETTSIALLRKLVDQVRSLERETGPDQEPRWMTVRGQVHQALAARGSRIALYDVKEALESSHAPLPVGFLSAAASIGDASCLEPLAVAWNRSAADDRWWREHLAEAFRAIVTRESITRRHPAMKRIAARYPSAAILLASARK